MKKLSNFVVGLFKIILSLINIILTLVIILNILFLLSTKVLKNEYPTILDYTYYVVEEANSSLNLNKGNLLIIDTRTSPDPEDIIVYQSENKLNYGRVTESDNYSATINKNGTNLKIDNESILGIILLNIPEAGTITNQILTTKALIISIVAITITGVLQGLLNKKHKKDNQPKPDFDSMKNI